MAWVVQVVVTVTVLVLGATVETVLTVEVSVTV